MQITSGLIWNINNNPNKRNRQTVNRTQENDSRKRKDCVDARPALRGAQESRSRRRLVARGKGGLVFPSASLTVAAGRWLWSGHTATEGIKIDDTAYQLACVTNIPSEHNTPTKLKKPKPN